MVNGTGQSNSFDFSRLAKIDPVCSQMFLKSSLQVNLDVRTNRQQLEQNTEEQAMLNDIKTVYSRSGATILQDATGAAAIVVMLAVGLYLPGLA